MGQGWLKSCPPLKQQQDILTPQRGHAFVRPPAHPTVPSAFSKKDVRIYLVVMALSSFSPPADSCMLWVLCAENAQQVGPRWGGMWVVRDFLDDHTVINLAVFIWKGSYMPVAGGSVEA